MVESCVSNEGRVSFVYIIALNAAITVLQFRFSRQKWHRESKGKID